MLKSTVKTLSNKTYTSSAEIVNRQKEMIVIIAIIDVNSFCRSLTNRAALLRQLQLISIIVRVYHLLTR